MTMSSRILIQVRNVKKYFPVGSGLFRRSRRYVKAVDGVSFDIPEGETYGLVGESGSGKTTLARVMLGLIEPTDGAVYFRGKNIFKLSKEEMRKIRREMQIIFQDPLASLNPRKTIEQTLKQVFKIHTSLSDDEILDRVKSLLEMVGLTPPERFLSRYPHELSGGQRQRVCIARAIALKPSFLIADEPVSALDVSIRGQIIKLIRRIHEEFNMAYLVITHDIALVKSMCKNVLVMYLGRLVEIGETMDVMKSPLHPYTQMLLSAVPIPNPEIARERKKHRVVIGEPPSPINPPKGCHFHPRCPYVKEICRKERPELIRVDGRLVACHLYM